VAVFAFEAAQISFFTLVALVRVLPSFPGLFYLFYFWLFVVVGLCMARCLAFNVK